MLTDLKLLATTNHEFFKGRRPAQYNPDVWDASRSEGMGCHLDPPGFPSYYLHTIENIRNPNRRHRKIDLVVCYGGDLFDVSRIVDLGRMYLPLPEDHPRVVAWMRELYRYLASCYIDDNATPACEKIVTGPRNLRHFHDDPRFSDAWRDTERAAVEAYNAEARAVFARLAIPENHAAVRQIRQVYPGAAPDLDLIAHPPTEIAHWWENQDAPPTPETCQPRHGQHPVNVTWCQHCGWRQE